MDRGEKAGINFLSLKTTKASTLVKNVLAFVRKIVGTSGRTRTGTPAKATDFESVMSTNFITLAQCCDNPLNVKLSVHQCGAL